MSGTPAAANVLHGAEETIRDFWASRPRRPRHGRKVAGVAVGIGERYRIDPVIVRVALVVGTLFGGAGVLLYLLAWLFLPDEGDSATPFEAMTGRGHSSTSHGFTVVLCVALIPALGIVFSGGGGFLSWGGFSGVLTLLLLLTGLYLLHRSRGADGRPIPVSAAPSSTAFAGTAPADWDYADWDPLAAAPLAWDLPDTPPPSQREPRWRPPQRYSAAGGVVFALGVLTAGICALLNLLGVTSLTPPHIVGITLAVLGLGMIATAFTHSGRGLVFPVLVLGAVGVLASGPGGWDGWHGVGEVTYRPTTPAGVAPAYQRSAGTLDVDLRGLPERGSVRTAISNSAGRATVTVPRTADVTATCAARAGHVDCLGRTADGVGRRVQVTDDGPDGPGGLRITLNVNTIVGEVAVRRD